MQNDFYEGGIFEGAYVQNDFYEGGIFVGA